MAHGSPINTEGEQPMSDTSENISTDSGWNRSPREVELEIQIDTLRKKNDYQRKFIEFLKEWDELRDQRMDEIQDKVRELSWLCNITPTDIIKVARLTLQIQREMNTYKAHMGSIPNGEPSPPNRNSGTSSNSGTRESVPPTTMGHFERRKRIKETI